MLFVLTGDVQTGKTRWLESLVHDLRQEGVEAFGVLAPGIWEDRRDDLHAYPHADANGFEKMGICNVLLPSGERIVFAQRADLALREGTYDSESQSGRAKLGWHISDGAFARVNDHFASLLSGAGAGAGPEANPPAGLLVIDELGPLELKRGEGLAQAVKALECGPTASMRHALVVVRESLLPEIEGRFVRWGETARVHPDDASRSVILETVLS